jgi:hypothetical protein
MRDKYIIKDVSKMGGDGTGLQVAMFYTVPAATLTIGGFKGSRKFIVALMEHMGCAYKARRTAYNKIRYDGLLAENKYRKRLRYLLVELGVGNYSKVNSIGRIIR